MSGHVASWPARVVSPSLLELRPAWLGRELGVGITVAALTLPSALGYAEVAGLPPVTGLYAAMAAMAVFGLLGASRHLVLGPDAAFAALIGAVLADAAGFDPRRALLLAPALAVLVAAGFLVLGLLRAGFLANFLSRPLLSGFMTGLALTIIVGQIPKILGIPAPATSVLGKLGDIAGHLGDVKGWSVALGVGTIVLSLLLSRLFPRIPVAAGLLTIGILAVAALNLDQRGVDVLGTVPEGLPDLAPPSIRWDDLPTLLTGALALVAIGFADAVLQGRQYARQAGYAAQPDRDLVAMGAANLACSVVGGYPVGASASRSAASLNGGGRTTLVSLVAAGIVALTLVLLAPYLAELPVPVLAGVVVAAAVRLLAFREIRALWPRHRAELAVALTAALGVVLAGVLVGVVLALVLSLVDFLRRAASSDVVVLGRRAGRPGWYDARRFPVAGVPGVLVLRYSGAIFFANADAIGSGVLQRVEAAPGTAAVVLHLSGVTGVDVTGLEMLARLFAELDRRGITVVVSGATAAVRDALADPLVAGRVPGHRIVKTMEEAIIVTRPPTDRRRRSVRLPRRASPAAAAPTAAPDPGPAAAAPGAAAPTEPVSG